MKKIARILLSKLFLLGVIAAIQLALIIYIVLSFSQKGIFSYITLTLISALIALGLIQNDKINSAYKNIWLFIIVALPITGFILYIIWGKHNNIPNLKKIKQIDINTDVTQIYTNEKFDLQNETAKKLSYYLENFINAPLVSNCEVEYLNDGKIYFQTLKDELLKAHTYIYMEFFIISKSKLWNEISEILCEKARAGVDVRIMYDGVGSMLSFDFNKLKYLKSSGVKIKAFNPLKIFISLAGYRIINFRDHRKICVIDGNTAFSGGVNIGDEYTNTISRFGYWKDNGFMINGKGALTYTAIFLKNWQLITKNKESITDYVTDINYESDIKLQTYWDSPVDYDDISEVVFRSIINGAKNYIYLTTPYLIIDNTLISTLSIAAESGVKVKIIVPGIPDKKIVNLITKSYYRTLIEAGVEIYEYTPGFIHSKMYISDDYITLIGTANTDYRSLYLNYENGTIFYSKDFAQKIRHDFETTLLSCKKIKIKDILSTSILTRALQKILRIFAPLF